MHGQNFISIIFYWHIYIYIWVLFFFIQWLLRPYLSYFGMSCDDIFVWERETRQQTTCPMMQFHVPSWSILQHNYWTIKIKIVMSERVTVNTIYWFVLIIYRVKMINQWTDDQINISELQLQTTYFLEKIFK